MTEQGDEENRFGTQLEKYRENPVDDEPKKEQPQKKKKDESSDDDSNESDGSGDSSSDDSDSDSDSDSDEAKKKDTKKKGKPEKKESDSDDEDDSDSSSSSSSSSDDSDSSDDDESSSGEEEEEEEKVVDKGGLPKKYAFLNLPHEQKTPEQRRWKWVKFEYLPDDMKPFIRPPTKKDREREKDKKKKQGPETTGEEIDQTVELVDDRDLDFKKMDNVHRLLSKYRNQNVNRRNVDVDLQIEILKLIMNSQSDNKPYLIETLLLLIGTHFQNSKNSTTGFFTRDEWLETSNLINQLITLLVERGKGKKQAPAKTEEGEEAKFLLSTNS